jgi:hypothetical protein
MSRMMKQRGTAIINYLKFFKKEGNYDETTIFTKENLRCKVYGIKTYSLLMRKALAQKDSMD